MFIVSLHRISEMTRSCIGHFRDANNVRMARTHDNPYIIT